MPDFKGRFTLNCLQLFECFKQLRTVSDSDLPLSLFLRRLRLRFDYYLFLVIAYVFSFKMVLFNILAGETYIQRFEDQKLTYIINRHFK